MILEFATITGKLEGNLIQVKIKTGEKFYAPLMTPGTTVSFPSQAWVSSYKSDFLAVVSYEGSSYNNPIILGLYPVKGAASSSYNSFEKLLTFMDTLIEILKAAKVNTLIGPQPFLPDTLLKLEQAKVDLEKINGDINEINL